MNQKGLAKIVLIIVIVAIVAVGGYFALVKKSEPTMQQPTPTPTQTETPVSPTPTSLPPKSTMVKPPSQISFDGCGKITNYSASSWYPTLIKVGGDNKIDINQISEACFSPNGNLLIFTIPGGYCGGPKIFKLDILSFVLKQAILDDKERGCLSSPSEFGKRDGNIIHLVGEDGDAGCSSTMYFDYNFIENKVELKQEYGICEGDETGTWHNY